VIDLNLADLGLPFVFFVDDLEELFIDPSTLEDDTACIPRFTLAKDEDDTQLDRASGKNELSVEFFDENKTSSLLIDLEAVSSSMTLSFMIKASI